LSQFQNETAFQSARSRDIEILETSGDRKSSSVDVSANTILAALRAFMIHEQSETSFEGELCIFRIGLLLLQSLAKGRQTQFEQLFMESLQGHRFFLLVIILIAAHIIVSRQGTQGALRREMLQLGFQVLIRQ
jgi:hypothetical protein